ncbi:NAD-dependent epimerase/dehydratase family protein [Flavobacterium sp. MMS24-S5]|uniref:NAD-dependent epimerase/dehydratase family protein n=1 Tax=Flavobacterium sp. MMS24-S5 TaxID=3416605 RepID=UPI003CFD8036
MILFTGSGAIANTFAKYYDCEIISARSMDDDTLANKIKVADVIIHNAALINSNDLSEFVDANFILTKRILEIISTIKPKIKFINLSSMSFLKDENQYLNSKEMSNYAFSKYLNELFCLKYPIENISNVRFSTIFYGDFRRDGLSKIVYDCFFEKKITIYNNGEAIRDFIPIEIAVQYLYKLTNLKTLPKIINIVSGRETSFKYFVNKLVELNPEIEIFNIEIETPKILSEFSKSGIAELGEIDFNIDELFEKYALEINENINI